MTNSTIKLPYFDQLLSLLDQGYPAIDIAFGRHVHWGYWQNPEQAFYSPEDYNNAAEQLTRQVYAATNVDNGQSVLDVGCGFGGTIALLNENFSQMNLVGLNIDPRQLERARKKVIAQNSNTVEFIEGNAIALPFPDQSFDVVLAVECIFHFPDRRQFFQEVYRVLKPGGRLALSDFIPADWFLPALIFTPNSQNPGFYGYFDLKYTVNRYRELADEVGFQGLVERDITVKTLPTFEFLRTLPFKENIAFTDFSALSSTLLLEGLSRLEWLRYMIFSFVKD